MPRLLPESLKKVRRGIEDAALGLFVKQGYAATTTRQIAGAAGVTAGALYNHYPGKEALFAAVASGYQARLGQDVDANPLLTLLANSRFPDDIKELAAAIRDLIADHRPYWLLWYIDVLEFGGKHFSQQLAPQALTGSSALQKRFDVLKQEKRLRLDPELAFVMTYMHLFNYFLVESVFSAQGHYGVDQNTAVDAIVDVFLQGMLSR